MWESFIHFPIKMLLVIKNILTGTMDKKVDDNEGRANKGKRGKEKAGMISPPRVDLSTDLIRRRSRGGPV